MKKPIEPPRRPLALNPKQADKIAQHLVGVSEDAGFIDPRDGSVLEGDHTRLPTTVPISMVMALGDDPETLLLRRLMANCLPYYLARILMLAGVPSYHPVFRHELSPREFMDAIYPLLMDGIEALSTVKLGENEAPTTLELLRALTHEELIALQVQLVNLGHPTADGPAN